MRGDNYEVIFEIDQRKCDLFSVIATYMGVYNADRNFRVLDTKVFTSNNITTFYIDFEENDPKFKSNSLAKQPPRRAGSPSPAS